MDIVLQDADPSVVLRMDVGHAIAEVVVHVDTVHMVDREVCLIVGDVDFNRVLFVVVDPTTAFAVEVVVGITVLLL